MSASDENHLLLVYEMTQIVTDELGLRERFAVSFAEAIVDGMRRRMGGVTIPAPNRELRDEAIRREFDGRNVREVARKNGVSRATAYRVIARFR